MTERQKSNLCERCNKNIAGDYHSCPFQEDVEQNKDEEFCNCCDECEDKCLAEI